MQVWRDADAELAALDGKTVAIIGYGTQGRAQALNLRDSGVRVVIGAHRDGPSWKGATDDGFAPVTAAEAATAAQVITLLVQDHRMGEAFSESKLLLAEGWPGFEPREVQHAEHRAFALQRDEQGMLDAGRLAQKLLKAVHRCTAGDLDHSDAR